MLDINNLLSMGCLFIIYKCTHTSDAELCSNNGFGIILSNIDTIVWQVQSQLTLSNFEPLDVIKFSKQYVLD